MRHGTGSGRGRHKGRRSPETRRWRELEHDLDRIFRPNDPRKPKKAKKPRPRPATPPPSRPAWLAENTYRGLIELRTKLNAAQAAEGGTR